MRRRGDGLVQVLVICAVIGAVALAITTAISRSKQAGAAPAQPIVTVDAGTDVHGVDIYVVTVEGRKYVVAKYFQNSVAICPATGPWVAATPEKP